ncbi:hypothetical protein L1987_72720 [Smallanthus sonchifolius]|uniref:Uncharacterized protein n=1 Tax=Smallanthus sonchifolius TaxID=185202 RepID=A0ACB9B0F4_9ASTR|nr:hypothetical protein L1987_72720 [Smallanthus sonchifolius]
MLGKIASADTSGHLKVLKGHKEVQTNNAYKHFKMSRIKELVKLSQAGIPSQVSTGGSLDIFRVRLIGTALEVRLFILCTFFLRNS